MGDDLIARSNTAVVTVANTTTETSIINGPAFSFPANGLVLGTAIRWTAVGAYSTKAVTPGTLLFDFILGAGSVGQVGPFTVTGALTSDEFRVDGLLTVTTLGATGDCFGQATATMYTGLAGATLQSGALGGLGLNTTIDNPIDLRVKWGTADPANSLISYAVICEWLGAMQ